MRVAARYTLRLIAPAAASLRTCTPAPPRSCATRGTAATGTLSGKLRDWQFPAGLSATLAERSIPRLAHSVSRGPAACRRRSTELAVEPPTVTPSHAFEILTNGIALRDRGHRPERFAQHTVLTLLEDQHLLVPPREFARQRRAAGPRSHDNHGHIPDQSCPSPRHWN